jgi:nucleoside-diphosphate-sugar epimerase
MMNNTHELHVIFGSGPVGSTIAEELNSKGMQVRLVNRSGKANVSPRIEVVAGDALNATVVRDLSKDASVVYNCMNVLYADWTQTLFRLQENLVAGAGAANAKLVVTDTLYMYGETHGKVMNEAMPYAATTRKGQLRAKLARAYLQAHQDGKVRVAIGRAADFFGPRVLNSALGERVFPAALAHKPVQLLGNVNLPHSYSYMKDVARGLIILGERDESLGRDWLLPVAPAVTQREMSSMIGKQLGYPLRIQVIPKLLVRLLGIFDTQMREYVEMMYQYAESQIVDSSAFARTFSMDATPLDEALRATIAWYRDRH